MLQAIVSGASVLEEFDPTTGAVGWSDTAPGGRFVNPFVTAPTLINGEVFEGDHDGNVYEFNGLNGQLIQMVNVGGSIVKPRSSINKGRSLAYRREMACSRFRQPTH